MNPTRTSGHAINAAPIVATTSFQFTSAITSLNAVPMFVPIDVKSIAEKATDNSVKKLEAIPPQSVFSTNAVTLWPIFSQSVSRTHAVAETSAELSVSLTAFPSASQLSPWIKETTVSGVANSTCAIVLPTFDQSASSIASFSAFATDVPTTEKSIVLTAPEIRSVTESTMADVSISTEKDSIPALKPSSIFPQSTPSARPCSAAAIVLATPAMDVPRAAKESGESIKPFSASATRCAPSYTFSANSSQLIPFREFVKPSLINSPMCAQFPFLIDSAIWSMSV